MEVVKIISEHKNKLVNKPVRRGFKRVMAIVKNGNRVETRHIEIPK